MIEQDLDWPRVIAFCNASKDTSMSEVSARCRITHGVIFSVGTARDGARRFI